MLGNNKKYTSIYINLLKCRLINFSDRNNADIVFNFDVVALSAESKGTHLGNIIGVNVHKDILQVASYTLTRNVNSTLHNIIHCSYLVKYKLFISYRIYFLEKVSQKIWLISHIGHKFKFKFNFKV